MSQPCCHSAIADLSHIPWRHFLQEVQFHKYLSFDSKHSPEISWCFIMSFLSQNSFYSFFSPRSPHHLMPHPHPTYHSSPVWHVNCRDTYHSRCLLPSLVTPSSIINVPWFSTCPVSHCSLPAFPRVRRCPIVPPKSLQYLCPTKVNEHINQSLTPD